MHTVHTHSGSNMLLFYIIIKLCTNAQCIPAAKNVEMVSCHQMFKQLEANWTETESYVHLKLSPVHNQNQNEPFKKNSKKRNRNEPKRIRNQNEPFKTKAFKRRCISLRFSIYFSDFLMMTTTDEGKKREFFSFIINCALWDIYLEFLFSIQKMYVEFLCDENAVIIRSKLVGRMQ